MNTGRFSPTLISVGLIIVFSAPHFAHAQMPQSVTAADLVVVDADGKEVGKVFGRSKEWIDVGFHLSERDLYFRLQIVRERIERGRCWLTYFETSDCSGTPYMQVLESPFPGESLWTEIFEEAAIHPSGAVFARDASAPAREIESFSRLSEPSPGICECVEETTPNVNVQPAVEAMDISQFTAPFSLRTASGAAACCSDCDRNGEVTVDEIITGVGFALGGCPK